MSRNNDGKYLEDALEKEFIKLTNRGARYRRLPDARTARGMFPAQPADFFISTNGVSAHVECKTSKSTTRRIPKFTQHAEMLAWAKAGVAGYLAVHLYELDELYMVDVTDLDISKPSWVLDETNSQYFTSIDILADMIMGVD